MITIPDMIKNRHQRIRSVRGPADLALCFEGSSFRCYMGDADKVNGWLKGTGLCEYKDLAEDPLFDDGLPQSSISLENMEKAAPLLQQHASIALVDSQFIHSKLTMLRFLVLKRETGPQPFPHRMVHEEPDLGDLF